MEAGERAIALPALDSKDLAQEIVDRRSALASAMGLEFEGTSAPTQALCLQSASLALVGIGPTPEGTGTDEVAYWALS